MTSQSAVEIAEPLPSISGPWKFWATTLWSLAIVGVGIVVGALTTFVILLQLNPDPDLPLPEVKALLSAKPGMMPAILSVTVASGLAMLLLAVRLSGLRMRDYLGLIAPRRNDLLIGLAGLAALYALFTAAALVMPRAPNPFVSNYNDALSSGTMLMLVAGLLILAPVGEELVIRGFMQRGWAASRLGPIGAIVLTSLVWTALHTQYDLFLLADIFCIGLLLGWLRQRSGSLVLTIFLHAAQNAFVLAHTALAIWSGAGALA